MAGAGDKEQEGRSIKNREGAGARGKEQKQ